MGFHGITEPHSRGNPHVRGISFDRSASLYRKSQRGWNIDQLNVNFEFVSDVAIRRMTRGTGHYDKEVANVTANYSCQLAGHAADSSLMSSSVMCDLAVTELTYTLAKAQY